MVRALVVAGPDGLAAGSVGDSVGASSSSASFHLAHLERAGLVRSHRVARSIIYTANVAGLSGLVEFLMADCCQGHPEICAPAAEVAASCRVPAAKEIVCAC
jgi:DNA-binding transcriptional ArsR family regulator